MLEAAAVVSLGGLLLYQYTPQNDAAPDLSKFASEILVNGCPPSGSWESGGQAIDWLADGASALLFLTARPRVSMPTPAFLPAFRDLFSAHSPTLRPGLSSTRWSHAAQGSEDQLCVPAGFHQNLIRLIASHNSMNGGHAGSNSAHDMGVKRGAQDDAQARPQSKGGRRWDADSHATDGDLAAFDHSDAAGPDAAVSAQAKRAVGFGGHAQSMSELDVTAGSNATESRMTALLARVGLGSKRLSRQDLEPVLAAMREHLAAKNVAIDVAADICRTIGAELENQNVTSFSGGVKGQVKRAMETSLTRLLTPKSGIDLLGEISRRGHAAASGAADPYVLTFVGVNGVGKSTNLAKIAFFLLQNNLRVLIAACDTFRSGAVEQLRTHVRNLKQLEVGGRTVADAIELHEAGYGRDAAGIAKEAIAFAKQRGFSAVLIDTAGRMQDNEPLMRALGKLVSLNRPDKVVFVGEALAGNEALDQITHFDSALKRFSSQAGKSRGIDAIILTKYETVDSKVGAAVSLTYKTGCPLMAVGVGQTYSDLRTLRVASVVQALLRD